MFLPEPPPHPTFIERFKVAESPMFFLVLVSLILPCSVSMLPGLSQGYQLSPFHRFKLTLSSSPPLPFPSSYPSPQNMNNGHRPPCAVIVNTYLHSVPVHVATYMRTFQARRLGSGRRSILMAMELMGGISVRSGRVEGPGGRSVGPGVTSDRRCE